MVLPEPALGGEIGFEFRFEGEGSVIGIDGDGARASGIHAQRNDLIAREIGISFFGLSERGCD